MGKMPCGRIQGNLINKKETSIEYALLVMNIKDR